MEKIVKGKVATPTETRNCGEPHGFDQSQKLSPSSLIGIVVERERRMGANQESPSLITDVSENRRRNREETQMGEHKEADGKVISTIGFILHLLLVAIPKDLHLWVTRRRKDVRGQTVVITGAASGIGQRMAEIFAIDLGANVAIVDMDLAKAEVVAQSIRDRQGHAAAFQSDVTCPKTMEACATSIRNTFGRVDIVICNAAILYFAHTLELTAEQLQRAYNVNVLGVLHTIRAFLPEFEHENRGQIVAMSSIAGFYGETYGIAYCPTKFAVRGIMECLQMEFRDRGLNGIKCTTLCPYFVRTPMILNMGMRPTSRFIPFMSVNRCCARAVDAILKEKPQCFIPGYIYIMSLVKSLLFLHIGKASRDWLNCRYVPVEGGGAAHATKVAGERNSETPDKGSSDEVEQGEEERVVTRPQMVNYFKVPNLLWFLIIPGGLAFTFIIYYNVNWIPTQHLSFFGNFIHTLGTRYNWLVQWICIAALVAHILEAVYAMYICDDLGFSHSCSLKWFIQTFILGFPSLRLLLKYRTRRARQRE